MEENLSKLLPAWFIGRMTSDTWNFGLMTVTGTIICIHCIQNIYQASNGDIWLDVELMTDAPTQIPEMNMFYAPTERTTASINASHIIAAFELTDT